MKKQIEPPSVGNGQDKLLTADEVAEALGLTVGTIRDWTYERKLPHVKFGRRVRYRASIVDALVLASEIPAIPRSDEVL